MYEYSIAKDIVPLNIEFVLLNVRKKFIKTMEKTKNG